jgi:hypothetical protein
MIFMKIQLSSSGEVDFEAPINVSEAQRKKFIDFMKNLLEDVSVENVIEKTRKAGKRINKIKKWVLDEYVLLFDGKSNEELAEKMNRSSMSVSMMRGHFVPAYIEWDKGKGRDGSPDMARIKQFIQESEGE